MSSAAITRRALAPLAIVTAAALLFAFLLVLVRLQWGPLASVLFAVLWLTATTRLIQPNEDAFRRGALPGLPRRKTADKSQETVQSMG